MPLYCILGSFLVAPHFTPSGLACQRLEAGDELARAQRHLCRSRRSDRHRSIHRVLRRSGGWGIPQTNLRLFNAMAAEQQADREPRHKAWRDCLNDEMLSLSPTAQAWAAGFLPVGAVILLNAAADRGRHDG